MEKSGVMPKMDSDVPSEGIEKRLIIRGSDRCWGGLECSVNTLVDVEYVAKVRPIYRVSQYAVLYPY